MKENDQAVDKSPPFLASTELLVRGSKGAARLDLRRGKSLKLYKPFWIKIAPFELICRKRDGFGPVNSFQDIFDQSFISKPRYVIARLLQ